MKILDSKVIWLKKTISTEQQNAYLINIKHKNNGNKSKNKI